MPLQRYLLPNCFLNLVVMNVHDALFSTCAMLCLFVQIVDDCPEEDLSDFLVEINILTECSHPNIVGLEESYYVNGKLWMLLEFCGAGKKAIDYDMRGRCETNISSDIGHGS